MAPRKPAASDCRSSRGAEGEHCGLQDLFIRLRSLLATKRAGKVGERGVWGDQSRCLPDISFDVECEQFFRKSDVKKNSGLSHRLG